MTIKTILAALVAMSLTTMSAEAEGFSTGQQKLKLRDTVEHRHLSGFVWYPTKAEQRTKAMHGNGVWKTIDVMRKAPVAEGKHPLVVVSHGMFGNVRNQAWLAADLTSRGYIVAAVNHPGTTTFDQDHDERRMLWKRQTDITRVIDHLTADETFSQYVDADRIFMAGHSLGGFTAVSLAGGRYAPSKVDAMCEAGEDDVICEIINGWEVAKIPEDRVAMSADLSDPRIKAFAVFDLGGTQMFTPESLAALSKPMQVWGASDDIHRLDLDRESRALVAAVPEGVADYQEPEGLAHMDFLGECTEKALMILEDEEPEDVFVCINGTDERRAEHEMIAEKVDAFFASH